MTSDNANAFNRLVAVMSGDYAQLLMRGELVVRTDDPDGWRKEIRDKARLDRLKIRTGRSQRDPHVVWALRILEREAERDDADGPEFKTLTYQHHVQAMARANGHTFDRWIINHEGRAAGRCTTCAARAYIDCTGDIPIVDGEVIDEACAGVWAPPDGQDG
jgi:hypothetical protein